MPFSHLLHCPDQEGLPGSSGHSELPQENHLTAEWRGKVSSGRKLTFLTVFVPLSEGTTTPPHDLKLSIEAGQGSVKLGAFRYVFPSER